MPCNKFNGYQQNHYAIISNVSNIMWQGTNDCFLDRLKWSLANHFLINSSWCPVLRRLSWAEVCLGWNLEMTGNDEKCALGRTSACSGLRPGLLVLWADLSSGKIASFPGKNCLGRGHSLYRLTGTTATTLLLATSWGPFWTCTTATLHKLTNVHVVI